MEVIHHSCAVKQKDLTKEKGEDINMLFLVTAYPIVQSSKNRIQFSNMTTEQYILYVQQVILSVFTFIDSFNRTMMN